MKRLLSAAAFRNNAFLKRSGLFFMLQLLLAFASTTASAQEVTPGADQMAVLHKSIELDGLQAYYPKTANGSFKGLKILQHGVSFAAGTSISHGGNAISFLTKGDLQGNQTEAYFLFHAFQINGNSARVEFIFNYDVNTAQPKSQLVELDLVKTGAGWTINQTKIEAR